MVTTVPAHEHSVGREFQVQARRSGRSSSPNRLQVSTTAIVQGRRAFRGGGTGIRGRRNGCQRNKHLRLAIFVSDEVRGAKVSEGICSEAIHASHQKYDGRAGAVRMRIAVQTTGLRR